MQSGHGAWFCATYISIIVDKDNSNWVTQGLNLDYILKVSFQGLEIRYFVKEKAFSFVKYL